MLKCMSTLQVRDVPEDVRRTLKLRAAAAGQSLSEYLLSELSRLARQPTLDELTTRVRHRGLVEPTTRAAELLRADRAARR
jgi:plasmid stability protein